MMWLAASSSGPGSAELQLRLDGAELELRVPGLQSGTSTACGESHGLATRPMNNAAPVFWWTISNTNG
jgi:hypothetical protein